MYGSNFLRRKLRPHGERLGVPDLTFQAMRRTCATRLQQFGGPKDAQRQLRHTSPATTLAFYVEAIPESGRNAVEKLDETLFQDK